MSQTRQLDRLVADLEGATEELTDEARQIGCRGLEASEARALPPERMAQMARLNLCQPAYAFVRFLWQHDLLPILAEHAQLKPAPEGLDFPYQVPVIPDPAPQILGWQLDAALGMPQVVASARLLLWFAVAWAPKEFQADSLFAGRLMILLPWVRGPAGKVHPIRRPKHLVHQAAAAVVKAYRLRLGKEHATSDSPVPVNADGFYDSEPPADSEFSKGPLEAPLKHLARWMEIDTRTLKKHNGRTSWWIKKLTHRKFAVWFTSKKKFAQANQNQIAERMRNDT